MSAYVSALVDAIVARVQESLGSAASVVAFPDAPESYPVVHPQCSVLVQYQGSSYVQAGPLTHKRTAQFDLHILTPALHGSAGAGKYIAEVLASVCGWSPSKGCGRFVPVADGYLTRLSSGLWQHYVRVRTLVPYYGQSTKSEV
ncbi:MAG: hypothetical protein HY962_07130 [Ignavibacteriae bacterium]|nr:hypothetical protein [Ignavibacteriota bacterium]